MRRDTTKKKWYPQVKHGGQYEVVTEIDFTKRKKCKQCGEIKTLDLFKVERKRCTDGTSNTCKKCYSRNQTVTHKIREDAKNSGKPLPDFCECCGKYLPDFTDVHADHIRSTEEHRGWLCAVCNRSIGMLGDHLGLNAEMTALLKLWFEENITDEVTGVMNAVRYLLGIKRTKPITERPKPAIIPTALEIISISS